MKKDREAVIGAEQKFYAKCGELLNQEHEYHVPYLYRTRWNNRVESNGKFPGFGVIQNFGGFIRVMCKDGTFMFDTYEDVYEFIRGR